METRTELKDFQITSVEWMDSQEQKYEGGLLFNEPGTGKTLCCLDLIIKKYNAQIGGKLQTLILCPSGLVNNWIDEIKKHTSLQEKNIFVYVGTKRRTMKITSDHVIFISSYNIASREKTDSNKKVCNSLFDNLFTRIILDEAHYIRNSNGNVFKSVVNIESEFKWIVTATPIFNKIDDMYGYFRFLQLAGVDSKSDWRILTNKTNGIHSLKVLNDIIDKHSLNFKKQDVLKDLPNKNEILVEINMNDFEKDFYDNLWDYSVNRMKTIALRLKNLNGLMDINSKTLRQVLSNNILVYILRLKQCCNSPWLVIKKMKRLTNVNSLKEASEMLSYYNQSKQLDEECPICYDNIADTIASPCGHKCCESCWTKLFKSGLHNCPKCRSNIDKIDSDNKSDDKSDDKITEYEMKNSSKIQKLIEIIKEKIKKQEKVVIVSQWIETLNIVREIINKHFRKLKSITLQGSVSMKRRKDNIYIFQNDPTVKICYVSLMSSAEGINLTSANNLVLLDMWWNNSKMIQVCDRIHRIGQINTVNIYKFIISSENSIELRIQQLVNKKSKISNLIVNKWGIQNMEDYDSTWISQVVKLVVSG